MAVSFQEQCNAILDDINLFEEDKVDMVQELVTKKFGSKMSDKKIEEIVLDIMWKHIDPNKKSTPRTEEVAAEEFKVKVDIPSLERRLQLQKELFELEAANEAERKKKFQTKVLIENSRASNEYSEIVKRKAELYGDSKAEVAENLSPIDQIFNMFNRSVSKSTIEQALKSTGYNLVDAASLIMKRLKIDNVSTQEKTPPAEDQHSNEPNPHTKVSSLHYKAPCSFLMKSGSCLRSDCPYNHDLKNITCSYWLKGNCFNKDSCQFKHSLDEIKSITSVSSSSSSNNNPAGSMKYNPKQSSVFVPSFNASKSTTFIPTSLSIQTDRPKIVITKPLRKPKYTPWENTDFSSHFKTYMAHKAVAFKHESHRKKFAQSSTEAWKHNNSHEAKKLSEKASKFEKKHIDELKLADDALAAYSDTCDDEIWYEMYGLEFSDATDELQDNINEVKKSFRKGSVTIYLVVPPMADTYGYKRTTRPITHWLESELYRFITFPQGSANNFGDVVGIDPWSI